MKNDQVEKLISNLNAAQRLVREGQQLADGLNRRRAGSLNYVRMSLLRADHGEVDSDDAGVGVVFSVPIAFVSKLALDMQALGKEELKKNAAQLEAAVDPRQ